MSLAKRRGHRLTRSTHEFGSPLTEPERQALAQADEYIFKCGVAADAVGAGVFRLEHKGRANFERLDGKTVLINRKREVAQTCQEAAAQAERDGRPCVAVKLRQKAADVEASAARLMYARSDLYDAQGRRSVVETDGPAHRRVAVGRASLRVGDDSAEMYGDLRGVAEPGEFEYLRCVGILVRRAEGQKKCLGSLRATSGDVAAAEKTKEEALGMAGELDRRAAEQEREGRDSSRLRALAKGARQAAALLQGPLAVYRHWAAARLSDAAERIATQTRLAYRRTRRFAPRRAARGFRAMRRASAVVQKAASGGGGGDDGSGVDPAPKAPAASSFARRPTFASVLRTVGGAP